jgi:hypothetical protein
MTIKKIGIPGALLAGLALTAEPTLHKEEKCGEHSVCQSKDFVEPSQEHTHEHYSTRYAGEIIVAAVTSTSSNAAI